MLSEALATAARHQARALDRDVLCALAEHGQTTTYVIRNRLDRPGTRWHRSGLRTSDILRACRRLQKAGLIFEAPSNYAVMKDWAILETGRTALQEKTDGE